MSSPAALYETIKEEASTVVVGNEPVLEGLTISLLTDGHVLLEGVPGVAKTTIANVFATTLGLRYSRIQMTPDMVPADVVGTNVYRQNTGEFELKRGPIFANIAVADEINRATPKTQSALLEAMEERNVTVDGETLSLPDPFMVIATQNPIEMEGVFELPEAQRDRFQLKYVVDLPDRDIERDLLDRFDSDPTFDTNAVTPVVDAEMLADAQQAVREVHLAEPIKDYILDLVATTRTQDTIRHGASPRATLGFVSTAKARAAIHGRDYVIPDDVKALGLPVLRHRLIRTTDAELADTTISEVIESIFDAVAPPSSDMTLQPAAVDSD